MKKVIKEIMPGGLIELRRKLRNIFVRLETLERNQLSFLRDTYGAEFKSEINSKEFKVYSQNGEDGVLLYIFSKIGVKNKKVVEIGIEEGKECNSANLIINFGWEGLLIEADSESVLKARNYYKNAKGIPSDRIRIAHCLVSAENINEVILKNGISGEIDMLSIDIDGNDYWVLEKVEVVNPRVIVMEYNASIPKDKSLSVPYDPKFDRFSKPESRLYHGASLKAMTKIANKKGYVLVGCESTGCNAFFVRKDLAKDKFKGLKAEEAFYSQIYRVELGSVEKQFDRIKNLDWEKI